MSEAKCMVKKKKTGIRDFCQMYNAGLVCFQKIKLEEITWVLGGFQNSSSGEKYVSIGSFS